MSKRKTPTSNDLSKPSDRVTEEDESSSDDGDLLNVDFEWFDPQETDFHGLKVLLRQLFDVDCELFDLSALSNLILSQPLLGSTVKTGEDGMETNETDPFAFLTVLNLHTHRTKPEVQSLINYLASKASSGPLSQYLDPLLSPTSDSQVGLILTERFINMPHEIQPPMYKMLVEEISWALEEKEPYNFSHYLILSKTYTEITSSLPSNDASQPAKKKKKAADSGEIFYFHPEDEVLAQHAIAVADFEYTRQGAEGASDAKRAFQEAGIRPMGRLTLLDASKFGDAIKAVEAYVNPNQ